MWCTNFVRKDDRLLAKWGPITNNPDKGTITLRLGGGDEVTIHYDGPQDGAKLAILFQQAADAIFFNLNPPADQPPIEPGDTPAATMCDEG